MNDNYTIEELKERLARCDEMTILELLDLSSEELVEFLTDCIEEKYEEINEYFSDATEDD